MGIETVPITISVLDNGRVKTLAKRGVKIVDSVYVRMYSALHKGRTITGGEDISITRNRAFITMANLVLRILNFFYAKSFRY